MNPDSTAAGRGTLRRRFSALKLKAGRFDPTVKGILWTICAGALFAVLNASLRQLTLQIDPYQVQFLRYFVGMWIMLALVFRSGLATGLAICKPHSVMGHFTRGAAHTIGLIFWFTALPKVALADMTAIGFTGPIFIMMGAYLFFKEPMHWERWLAALIGFAGVMVVVGPKLTAAGGYYNLVMLASAPMFAASFLLTKALTRVDTPQNIVLWQSISVSILSLPMALMHWTNPTAAQWSIVVLTALLGSLGHYCLTRSFQVADISATQSVKFLDLVWSAAIGWLMFSDSPSQSTILGGTIICASTIWIARRESNRANRASVAASASREAARESGPL
jgi:drug/metabolite transporter (DMT)-like permease